MLHVVSSFIFPISSPLFLCYCVCNSNIPPAVQIPTAYRIKPTYTARGSINLLRICGSRSSFAFIDSWSHRKVLLMRLCVAVLCHNPRAPPCHNRDPLVIAGQWGNTNCQRSQSAHPNKKRTNKHIAQHMQCIQSIHSYIAWKHILAHECRMSIDTQFWYTIL